MDCTLENCRELVWKKYGRRFLEILWEHGCDVYLCEPMSGHVSFRLGGCVELFIVPNTLEALLSTLEFLKRERLSFRLLGNGTNIVPSDGLMETLVISMERINDVHFDGTKVYASAGVSFKKLCLLALKNGLSGFEKAYGLPGSVGGAIYMNAGCYGWETAESVLEITVFDGNRVSKISKDEAQFGYRSSIFKREKDLVILGATFSCQPGDKSEIEHLMMETLRQRYEKQPLEYPSAGSVFKRPRQDFYVGTAIEKLGLKGYTIGGAQISEKHAGFIINKGGASASDVKALVEFVRNKVKEAYNVELETEIEFWE
ncbi:UDP-N-acetylmuramate dehydrogenase [Fervidobacterium thailandense]